MRRLNARLQSSENARLSPCLNQYDPYGVLATVHVIGANIFPYWGGSPEKNMNGSSVASNTQATARNLNKAVGKPVIVTEEGRPTVPARRKTHLPLKTKLIISRHGASMQTNRSIVIISWPMIWRM